MQAPAPISQHEHEPALVPYLRALRTHKLVVIGVTIVTVVAAMFWLAVRDRSYEASAQMLISPISQDDDVFIGLQVIRGSDDPTRTVQTAAALLKSQAAAERTARALGDGWTARRVLDSIQVEPQGESNILAITGTAGTAAGAARLANTFAESSLDVRLAELRKQVDPLLTRLQARLRTLAPDNETAAALADRINQLETVQQGNDPSVSIAQEAISPQGPTGASGMVILALALFAGLALGAATAVLMELLNPRVRDEDEAMSIYPLPILTRVPRLSRRARRAEESRAWIVPPAVREAFRTLAVQLPAANGRGGRVVMVTSASTGDGKTTSAINLAVSLATSGERVLLLDFDVRKPDVGRRLHVANPVSPSDLLGENLDLEAMLTTVAQLPAVSVLALAADQNTDPGFVEMLHRRLPALLAEARPLADTIIVDTAPLGEVSDALRLVPAMDDVLAVVRLGSTDRANLRTMRDLLERTGRSPRGFILIGDVPSSQSGHYGYGGGERELILSSSSPARPDAS